jgi:aspartyl aminopeptidase
MKFSCNVIVSYYNMLTSWFHFQALIDATSSDRSLEEEPGIRMVALFDHEECGSNSAQGAGSPVVLDAMSRITDFFSPNSKVSFFF